MPVFGSENWHLFVWGKLLPCRIYGMELIKWARVNNNVDCVVKRRKKEYKLMKTHKALVAGIALAGVLLMLQSPLRIVAQDTAGSRTSPGTAGAGARSSRPGGATQFSVGSVSFQPGGEGDWVQAVANRPLTTGDNLWADKDSRAELQTGSTSIRMDSETSLTFLDLDDRTTQLKLSQGSIFVRVRHLDDEDQFEIDTPNLAFQIQRTGEYRIDVNADGTETDARVWMAAGKQRVAELLCRSCWAIRQIHWH